MNSYFVLQVTEQTRWVNKQDHRQRSLGQIFVKGDNVIIVSCLQSGPLPPAPTTATGD